MPMSIPEEDSEPTDEFQEMLRIAERDARITGIKYSLQRVRSGALALLSAAVVCGVSGICAFESAILIAIALRIDLDLSIFAGVFYFAAAGLFVGLYWLAPRNPLFYSVVGLVLYSLLCIPSVVIIGNAFWLFELLVMFALVDAVRVNLQHRRIVHRTLMSHEDPPADKADF